MRVMSLAAAVTALMGCATSQEERNARIREVVQGPDGALYLLTDAANGSLLKITPRS